MPASPFIAEIFMFAGTFAPRGFAFCNGAIMSIAQNQALFALLGTTYGGNGQTTFALPDLRGRVPVGTGTGPGLPNMVLGQLAGSPTHTLISTEMPAHTHTATASLRANSGAANDSLPTGNYLAEGSIYNSATNTQMNAGAVQVTNSITGGSQPFSIEQPYLGMNFVIAIVGLFPSRN